ncbi:hypothetical protein NJT12_23625 [Flavobacterium sp. AC]|uniref:Glycoside hydrolase family 42 N-terminal domain-containing protein n=1 Tax=Flavobacterium azizsancarii TaxID=2961580 RepID=A0ABT4WJ39_9FLAO|nr:hypothetical protein [Flavobacterium azizsancarii]MDA6072615.1 hypothetical protein [Flavobacterium azizsancarii]
MIHTYLSKRVMTLMLLLFCVVTKTVAQKNYIYFNHREKAGENIQQDKALHDARFQGAQIVYTWRSLEPTKGQYDFSAIREDIAYLNSLGGKKVWIQLQEKSFAPNIKNVPDYILEDPIYEGGILKQSMLSAPERDPNKAITDDEYGWSSKMWMKPVRDRFQKLILALGNEFDGKIEGINFSESSIDIGTENTDEAMSFPADFSPRNYIEAIESNMVVLSKSFRESTAMVYLNFLPDEWLPWDDKGYMRGLFAKAKKLKMGVGGPDLMPYRKSHMNQTYGFFKEYPDDLVKAMAVQDGNLRQINPQTNKKNTVKDILEFAKNYLGLDYIFWVEEEPYFNEEVLRDLPK